MPVERDPDARLASDAQPERLVTTAWLAARLDDPRIVVAYCRSGERSSHTWFVLKHLLGLEKGRNDDGSWVEWGNAVRVPSEK